MILILIPKLMLISDAHAEGKVGRVHHVLYKSIAIPLDASVTTTKDVDL